MLYFLPTEREQCQRSDRDPLVTKKEIVGSELSGGHREAEQAETVKRLPGRVMAT